MKTKITKFILLIFGILIGLFLSLSVLEIYLRASNKFSLSFGTCKETKAVNQAPNLYNYRLSEDLLVGWEHNPADVLHRINSAGFWGSEHKIQKKKNTYRIIVIGDSITEMDYYVRSLEYLLNNANLKSEFEVWNCAVGGYGIINYYGILRSKILRFNPDMIIIGFCLNDLLITPVAFRNSDLNNWIIFENSMNEYPAYYNFPANLRFFEKSYAYRFLLFSSQRLIKGNLGKSVDDKEIGGWALAGIKDITEKRNIKLLGVIIPYFKNKYNKEEKTAYARETMLLAGCKIRYLDLHGKFPDIDDLSWRNNRRDWVHPSVNGHIIIAREIYNYLLKDTSWWQKGQ